MCDISSGSVHAFLLRQYMQFKVRISTSWHLLIILSTSSLSSFKNLLNVFIVFPAKPRVEISRRIKLTYAQGVMNVLCRLLYLLALNSSDLLKLVSNGQVSSVMVIRRFSKITMSGRWRYISALGSFGQLLLNNALVLSKPFISA